MLKVDDWVYVIPKENIPKEKLHPEVYYADEMSERYADCLRQVTNRVGSAVMLSGCSYYWHPDWLRVADGYSAKEAM